MDGPGQNTTFSKNTTPLSYPEKDISREERLRMDYSQGEEIDLSWAELPQGPRSDSQLYERMNPFSTLPPVSQAQISTESRYGLDSSNDTMAWTHHQVPYHGHTPSLHLTQDDEPDFELFDRTYSHSTLGSPTFDQNSFVSLSPQITPGEASSKRTSYFQTARSVSGSDEPSHMTTAARKKERAQHNVVEHRYREKLNSQIAQLKDKVPVLKEATNPRKGGKEPAKVGKSTILVKAGEYIDKLEVENSRLRKRNESLERLVQRLVQGRAGGSAGGFDLSELNIP